MRANRLVCFFDVAGSPACALPGVSDGAFAKEQKSFVFAANSAEPEDIADYDKILITCTDEIEDANVAYSGSTYLTTRNDYLRIGSCQKRVILSFKIGILRGKKWPIVERIDSPSEG